MPSCLLRSVEYGFISSRACRSGRGRGSCCVVLLMDAGVQHCWASLPSDVLLMVSFATNVAGKVDATRVAAPAAAICSMWHVAPSNSARLLNYSCV